MDKFIKKSTVEWVLILFILLLSFINTGTLLVSLILLLTLLRQKEIGAIKIINLVTFRTIMNPGFAVNISTFQNLKWIILIGCSVYLLFSFRKLEKYKINKIKWILFLLLLFAIYNFFIALVNSSLPVVSIFKLISYTVIFIGTLIGVGYTFDKFDWIKWMVVMFQIIIVFSFIGIKLPFSYMINGVSFQGILNQPNMFGIVAALFIAIFLVYIQTGRCKISHFYIFAIITLLLIIISRSRTGLITFTSLLFLYFLFKSIKKITKLNVSAFSFFVVLLILMRDRIKDFTFTFLQKGQDQGEMLNSRLDQIGTLMSNFEKHPWFGNGFMVPVLPFKSYTFSDQYVVEPGNLILSLLSFSGVIGFCIYIMFLIKILLVNKRNMISNLYVLAGVLLINMGEMVFFSSNSIGPWCYMFISIYIFSENKETSKLQNIIIVKKGD